MNFGTIRKFLDRATLAAIRDRLASFPGVADRLREVEEKDFNVHPTVPIATVLSSGIVDELLTIIDEVVEK